MSNLLNKDLCTRLKNVGFDMEVRRYYVSNPLPYRQARLNWNKYEMCASCPTQDECAEWLREKKGIFLEIECSKCQTMWIGSLDIKDLPFYWHQQFLCQSYADAQLQGITAAIEYLEQTNVINAKSTNK